MAAPAKYVDPKGLFIGKHHQDVSYNAMMQTCPKLASQVANQSVLADWPPWGETQSPRLAYRHCMRGTRQSTHEAEHLWSGYIDEQLRTCTPQGLGRALHAVQDCNASGHRGFQEWNGGIPDSEHRDGDINPTAQDLSNALAHSIQVIERFKKMCECQCE
jgi:hypothetical protein